MSIHSLYTVSIKRTLPVLLLAYSASASAVWTDMPDAWCKKKGFNPPCEVWLLTAKPAKDVATAKSRATPNAPKAGDIRRKEAAGK